MGRIFDYLLFMTPGVGIGTVLWLVFLRYRRKRLSARDLASGKVRELAMGLFWMFTGGMAAITLSPEPGWLFDRFYWAWHGQIREVFAGFGIYGGDVMPLEHRINLIPFAQGDNLVNMVGNTVMFLPFGFFAALLWRGWNGKRAAWAGLGITVSIECWQILAGRYFDIDDLILNTLGVFFGYWVWAALRALAPGFTESFHIHIKEESNG